MDQIPVTNQKYNTNPPLLKWYKKKWGIIVITIIILIILLFAIILLLSTTQDKKTPTAFDLDMQTPQRQLAEKSDRPSFGNPDAKLVIVEFSDFQCPVCQAEFPIIREISNKYKDQIRYIYRNYPVINENSIAIAHASLCAHEQDKFWPMHDKLFLSANSNGFSEENIKNIAKQSGLNMEKFDQCTESGKYQTTIVEDFQDGITLGVSGTPTFFINGNKLSGKIPKEAWEEVINELLNN